MLGVDLRPTAYLVESAEPPLANYVFGTVKAHGGAAIGVMSPNNVRVDRYPVGNPQLWLSDLMNLSPTEPETARQFVLQDGVIDVNAVLRRLAELPRVVRDFWRSTQQGGRVPFAVSLPSLWGARGQAKEGLALAERARQSDSAGMMARSRLLGALASGPLRTIGIEVAEGPAASLVAYVDPRTSAAAVDLCILAYYNNPEIANCVTCARFFRKSKPGRVFCGATCKNLYHVRKYRDRERNDAKTERSNHQH